MQDIDNAFKTAVALNPDDALDLLFGRGRQVKLQAMSDPQINVPELRADKALLVEDGGQMCYILFEAMLQPDRSQLPTFAFKALGMQYVQAKPVIVVIVYLEKGRYATFPDSFENRFGNFSNQFVLAKVLLWEHEARILNGELKVFLPFLPLFHERPDPGLMDVQLDLLGQIADPKLRADLMALAIVIDIRAWGTEVVLTKFVKEINMLKETSIVQDWMTKSRQDGWQEGRQEGHKEGQLALLQIILARKVGLIAPGLASQLRQLSSKQLDRLGEALLTINSAQDLEVWLRNGVTKESH